jgi:acetoin utilization protein AcuB
MGVNSRELGLHGSGMHVALFVAGVRVMSKPIPTVQKYMTVVPHTIGADQTMSAAHELMREHRMRHLPVMTGGKLVGLISDRDLHLVETLRDVDPTLVPVSDAMSPDPYFVSPDTPVDEVVSEMARHKYGCAIVAQNDKVVGIFTTVDVCKAFAELLNTRLSH